MGRRREMSPGAGRAGRDEIGNFHFGKAYAALGDVAKAREFFAPAAVRWTKHPWAAEMRQWLADHPGPAPGL